MRHLLSSTLGLLTLVFQPHPLPAQSLVKDLATGEFLSGVHRSESGLTFGNTILFACEDDRHGFELWQSDATGAGTQILFDLLPGPGSGKPNSFAQLNQQVLFLANSGTGHEIELWATDGTNKGTKLVQAFDTQDGDTRHQIVTAGNHAFVWIVGATNIHEVWVSDGTTAGTAFMARLQGQSDGLPHSSDLNGVLLFPFDDPVFGTELWRSDGTAAGTQMVVDLHPFAAHGLLIPSTRDDDPRIVTMGSHCYFAADDGNLGYELWRSDGTAAGTSLVADINPGLSASRPWSLLTDGNKLYFRGSEANTGAELWQSDGTTLGTLQVADLEPGSRSSAPEPLALIASTLFFSARVAPFGTEVWKLDQSGVPSLITDLEPGGFSISLSNPLVAGTWFAYLNGSKLQATDGLVTTNLHFAGTIIGAVNGRIVHEAGAPTSGPGSKLWSSDPKSFIFSNSLFPVSASNGSPGLDPIVSTGTKIWAKLWTSLASSDGTANNTSVIPQRVSVMANAGDRIYFADNRSSPRGLWSITDNGPPRLVADLGASAVNVYANNLYGLPKGALFFAGSHPTYGTELFWSDGTASGTQMISNINPRGSSNPRALAQFADGRVLFEAVEGTYGRELYITDGTAQGTSRFTDLAPQNRSIQVNEATTLGGQIFLSLDDGIKGSELWISNGTTTGTRIVYDLPNGGIHPTDLVATKSRVYFAADNGTQGRELWTSDGTSNGTYMLKDVRSGSTSSSPHDLAIMGDKVLFVANDGIHGDELWITDGTTLGTVILMDTFPGPSTSGIGKLTVIGNRVIFAAGGPAGLEPWVSDGTAAGTRMIADIAGGAAGSMPLHFTLAHDTFGSATLLFTAIDNSHGRELWSMQLRRLETSITYQYGFACSNQAIPDELDVDSLPRIGQALKYEVKATPSARIELLFGTERGRTPIGGCEIMLGANIWSVSLTSNAQGLATLALQIPNQLSLVGRRLYHQALVLRTGGALFSAVDTSRGLGFTLGR